MYEQTLHLSVSDCDITLVGSNPVSHNLLILKAGNLYCGSLQLGGREVLYSIILNLVYPCFVQ